MSLERYQPLLLLSVLFYAKTCLTIDCSDYDLPENGGIIINATCHPDGNVEVLASGIPQSNSPNGIRIAYNCIGPSPTSGILFTWAYNGGTTEKRTTMIPWSYADSACYFDGCYDQEFPPFNTFSILRVPCTVITPTPTVSAQSTPTPTAISADSTMLNNLLQITPTPSTASDSNPVALSMLVLISADSTMLNNLLQITPTPSTASDSNPVALTIITPSVTSSLLVLVIIVLIVILMTALLLAISRKRKRGLTFNFDGLDIIEKRDEINEGVNIQVKISIPEEDKGSYLTLYEELIQGDTLEDSDDRSMLMETSTADLEADTNSECSTYPLSEPSLGEENPDFSRMLSYLSSGQPSTLTSGQTSQYMSMIGQHSGASTAQLSDVLFHHDNLMWDTDDNAMDEANQDGIGASNLSEDVPRHEQQVELERPAPVPVDVTGFLDYNFDDEYSESVDGTGFSSSNCGGDSSGGYVEMKSGIRRT